VVEKYVDVETGKQTGQSGLAEMVNYLNKQKKEPAGSLFCLVHQFYLFSLLLNFSSIFGTTAL
jgi:hypothetical protein